MTSTLSSNRTARSGAAWNSTPSLQLMPQHCISASQKSSLDPLAGVPPLPKSIILFCCLRKSLLNKQYSVVDTSKVTGDKWVGWVGW